jgi:hypothetical protein
LNSVTIFICDFVQFEKSILSQVKFISSFCRSSSPHTQDNLCIFSLSDFITFLSSLSVQFSGVALIIIVQVFLSISTFHFCIDVNFSVLSKIHFQTKASFLTFSNSQIILFEKISDFCKSDNLPKFKLFNQKTIIIINVITTTNSIIVKAFLIFFLIKI